MRKHVQEFKTQEVKKYLDGRTAALISRETGADENERAVSRLRIPIKLRPRLLQSYLLPVLRRRRRLEHILLTIPAGIKLRITNYVLFNIFFVIRNS